MNRMFWKIFLSFWIAMILIVMCFSANLVLKRIASVKE